MSRELSVGEVAARSGVAVSALHFYERKGLIKALRSSGNQRRYDRDVLRRIAILRAGQELGISLAEIGEAFVSLPNGKTPTSDDWRKMSEKWAEKLDRRILLLNRLREELSGCIGCGCLSVERCKLLNPNDRLASEGTGAILFNRLSPKG